VSYTQQAAEPNASATVRGSLTPGAQTIGGVKTFANKIVVGPQAGNALEIDGADYIGLGSIQLGAFGSMIYTPNANGFRTQGASGFWMGGINSSFDAAGLGAFSQGNRVCLQQGQDIQVAVLTNLGNSAGVATKIGTYRAAPHASAELLRVGYGLLAAGLGDGTAVLKVLGGNRIIVGAAAAAPTDADLMNGSISFWLDEVGNNLKVRAKYSGGTLKTATIALV
jgi:hypothetical protein